VNHHGGSKVALVTGGTDGIGKAIARQLAAQGVQVIIVGRSHDKGVRAERDLRDSTRNVDVNFLKADLSLMTESRRLAEQIQSRWPILHYLVHSAGILRGRRELTAEGIESNFATNYLSRFALTAHLLPILLAAGHAGEAARIVLVSGAARNGKIHFDDVSLATNFSTLRAVSQFCEANDLYTVELARRLAVGGQAPGVTIACLKMGVVKTNIRRDFPGWMKVLVPLVLDPLLGQTPQEAANAALKLLRDKDLKGVTGALFLKITKLRQLAPNAHEFSGEQGRRLRDLSERLIGREVVLRTPHRWGRTAGDLATQ
jgi:NAD(P)-dependent dehydrogenase (short-subunit alcohol dehydrogenase family)